MSLRSVLPTWLSSAAIFDITKSPWLNGVPFEFSRKSIKFHKNLTSQIIKFGAPISIQGVLVNLSFLVIMMIGNSMGVVASAGMGVAQKLVGFIMLIPLSFSQAVSAFVAQNYGAKKYNRAKKVLLYSVTTSLACGIVMFYITLLYIEFLFTPHINPNPLSYHF